MRTRVLVSLLILTLVASPIVVPLTAAQATTTTPPTTTTTATNNTTTTTESHWMGSGDSGGLIGGGSFGIGPKAWFDAILNATHEKLKKSLQWQIRSTISMWIGTPYDSVSGTETAGNNLINALNTVMDDLRTDVYGAYVFPFLVMLVAIFLTMSAVAIPASTMFYNASLTRWMGKIGMAIIIVGVSYDFINILQQASNAIALGIAPSPTELTESLSGVFKLGAAPILGAVGLYTLGLGEAILLSLVYAVRQVALLLAPSVMPLALVIAYGAPHGRLRGAGSTIFWQWFSLCFVNIPVAILLRIAYEIEWSFGVGGLIGFTMTLGIFAGALILPFVSSVAFFKSPPSPQKIASKAAPGVSGGVSGLRSGGLFSGSGSGSNSGNGRSSPRQLTPDGGRDVSQSHNPQGKTSRKGSTQSVQDRKQYANRRKR